jgi:hypothetical protein
MKLAMIRPAQNALLVILSLLLSIILLEYLVRAFFPIYDPSGQVKLVQLADGTPIGPRGATLRQTKNTGDYDVEIRFNNLGFRDDKPLTAATKDDLFVVGDSFAFGWGVNVEDRFSDRIESALNRPVFNIASPGTNFDGYYRLIRYVETNGAVVRKLIISVTTENDLHLYSDFLPEDSNISEPTDLPSLNLLNEYSALYAMFTHAAHRTTTLRSVAVQLGLITPNLEGIGGDENISRKELTSSIFRLHQIVAGRDVVVLVIPSRRLWVGESSRRANAARVHATFVDGLRAYGMTVVDIRSQMEAGGNPLSYHFANDGHWNAAGHRLAAEALLEVLKQ